MTLDLLGRLVIHCVIYVVPHPALSPIILKHRPGWLNLAMAMVGPCNFSSFMTLWCICLAVAVANVFIGGCRGSLVTKLLTFKHDEWKLRFYREM